MTPTPNLTAALIKAQQAFTPAIKTAINPHFKSKFVDLAGVNDAANPALWANGLTVVQVTDIMDGGPVLITRLLHVSGEEIGGTPYPLSPARANDPQALGACVTYARRYAKMAILDIAPEDDDGQTASRGEKFIPPPHPDDDARFHAATADDWGRFAKACGQAGLDRDEAAKWLYARTQKTWQKIPRDDFKMLTADILEHGTTGDLSGKLGNERSADHDDIPPPTDDDAPPEASGANGEARSQVSPQQWKLIAVKMKSLGMPAGKDDLTKYVNGLRKKDHRSEAWEWKDTACVVDTLCHELKEHAVPKKFCPLCPRS